MDSSLSFDPLFQVKLPLPLAHLYTRVFRAKAERDRHDYAFYLVEASLKLVGFALISRYKSAGRRSVEVDAALHHVPAPSLGQWWDMVRALTSFLGGGKDGDPWVRRIVDRLGPSDRDGELARIFSLLADVAAFSGRLRRKTTALELLAYLPSYRNAMSGAHGSIKAIQGTYERATPALLGLAYAFLEGADILGGGRLRYADEVKMGEQGENLVTWMDLTGTNAIRRSPLTMEATSERILPGRLYLQIGSDEHLPLHPFICYRSDGVVDEVMYLNRIRRGRKGIEFLCYSTGSVYYPAGGDTESPLSRDVKDVLGWITGPGSDRTAVRAENRSSRDPRRTRAGVCRSRRAGRFMVLGGNGCLPSSNG